MRPSTLPARLLKGVVTNVDFADAQGLVEDPGFEELRVTGSHHVYGLIGIPEQLNTKPARASQALSAATAGHVGPSVRFEYQGEQVTTPAYPINVLSSDEDAAWVADVPDLAYCSALGDTPHEAVAEVEVAMAAWLEAAKSSGRQAPRPSARAIHA